MCQSQPSGGRKRGGGDKPQSRKAPFDTAVHSIFPSPASFSRYFLTSILGANAGKALVLGLFKSAPNSDGITRFTPAATAASISAVCCATAVVAIVRSKTSAPLSAAVRDAGESKSAVTILAPEGGLERTVEVGRARIVMESEGSARRAVRIGAPRLPVA
jgi:hypothetical protein